MPWGSRHVCRLTETQLRESGFRIERLPVLEDIDDPSSLARFLARARGSTLAHLVRELTEVLSPFRAKNAPSLPSYIESLRSGWLTLRAPPAHMI